MSITKNPFGDLKLKMSKVLNIIFLAVFTLFIISSGYTGLALEENTVYVISIEGTITMGTALDVESGIKEAIEMNADAILIELNTPGGLLEAMDRILEEIDNSPIPVITYVPKGAKSFSAGAFILLSGHVSAMSSGTATGAATPISLGMTGEASSVENKTVNAYAARIRGIAGQRGKNVQVAEEFVTEGKSLTSDEALDSNIIDLIADSPEDLLNRIDGKVVEGNLEKTTLQTRNSKLIYQRQTIRAGLLNSISNPQIAFLLLLVGMYGLIFGFMSPGTYVPEMIGAICLILALYGLGLFEVNVFGVILIVAAIFLFVAEALTPTFGILTVGGLICLILGAFMFPREPFLPVDWFKNFRILVYSISIVSAAFFIYALGAVIKIRKQKSTTGTDELIDRIVKAETDITQEGKLKIRGEIWNAKTDGDPIQKGEDIRILGREGLTLIVEKANDGGKDGNN